MIRVRIATPSMGGEMLYFIRPSESVLFSVEEDFNMIEEIYPGCYIIETSIIS